MISSRFRMVSSPSLPAGFETVTRPDGTRYAVTAASVATDSIRSMSRCSATSALI